MDLIASVEDFKDARSKQFLLDGDVEVHKVHTLYSSFLPLMLNAINGDGEEVLFDSKAGAKCYERAFRSGIVINYELTQRESFFLPSYQRGLVVGEDSLTLARSVAINSVYRTVSPKLHETIADSLVQMIVAFENYSA